jgi:hypothetical protein
MSPTCSARAKTWLHDLSIDMGRLHPGRHDGIECLQQIIADERPAGRAPPPVKSPE